MLPFRLAWLHNVEKSRKLNKDVDVKVGLFLLFFSSSMSGTFSSTYFISFDDFIQSWFVYVYLFSSRPRILSGSGHFHSQISSLLMISSRPRILSGSGHFHSQI